MKRFDNIVLTFPIRGHSYLECDKNMGLVNAKTAAEVPSEWWSAIREARKKPAPFVVHEMYQSDFLNFTYHLRPKYKKNCPFSTHPIREIVFSHDKLKGLLKRTSWNGMWENITITATNGQRHLGDSGLSPIYLEALPISKAKFEDLQVLKQFCLPSAQDFFNNLPCQSATEQ